MLAHSRRLLPSVQSQHPVDSAHSTCSITTVIDFHIPARQYVLSCCPFFLLSLPLPPSLTSASQHVLLCCPFCLLIRGTSYQVSHPSVLSTQRVPLAPLPPARQYILSCCPFCLLIRGASYQLLPLLPPPPEVKLPHFIT